MTSVPATWRSAPIRQCRRSVDVLTRAIRDALAAGFTEWTGAPVVAVAGSSAAGLAMPVNVTPCFIPARLSREH